MGIEKTISVQKVFSKSCFPWSMLPEKPRLISGFHKKVFMKRPTVHGVACVVVYPPMHVQNMKTINQKVRKKRKTFLELFPKVGSNSEKILLGRRRHKNIARIANAVQAPSLFIEGS